MPKYQRKHFTPEIKKINGIPRIFVDGVELPTILYRNRAHEDYKYMKKFVDTGHKLYFMTRIMPPDGSMSWEAYCEAVRKRICAVLDLSPDIFVILGYYLSISDAHIKEHPEDGPWDNPEGPEIDYHVEAARVRETALFSLYSDRIKEEQKKQANIHIDIIESLPDPDRVIGMFFEGGGAQEWYNFNSERYSPAMLKKYHEFLMKRYKTDETLAKSYGKPGLTIEKALMPEEAIANPQRGWLQDTGTPNGRASVDWYEFAAQEHLDMILTGPAAAKKRRPDLLTGFFCEHLLDCEHFIDPFKKVIESPYVDFISGPSTTEANHDLTTSKLSHSLVASIHLHNKLWFQEEDTPPMEKESLREIMTSIGEITKPEHYVDLITHVSCKNIVEGIYAWWWDFQKQWFKSKIYWPRLKKLQAIDKKHRVLKPKPAAEAAVFVSEQSEYYMPNWPRNTTLVVSQTMYYTFPRMGAPYEVYNLEDVLHPDFPLDRIKTAFFIDCIVLNEKEREAVEKLKSKNRTLVFYWASGLGKPKENGSIYDAGNMKALTGINFLERTGQCTPTMMSLPGEHKICELYGSGRFFGMVNELRKGKTPRNKNMGKFDYFPFVCINPVLTVDDPQTIPLAYYVAEMLPLPDEKNRNRIDSLELLIPTQFNKPSPTFVGAAIKEMKNWTSIYLGTNYVQWELLNCILRASSVHTYVDNGDLVFANSRMLAVRGYNSAGIRNISLPGKIKVVDAFSNKTIGKVKEFKANIKAFETKCFHLG
ncbi:MAG: hypothetical protein A3J83_04550 [Elusimicrobia bacterium RIFOXYA2_FULL_40_6]|nr:MAG: hypothetical protein A3J83_04550 [Elusimicrobia bacterium RIFOXYA2_FULL_40_6]